MNSVLHKAQAVRSRLNNKDIPLAPSVLSYINELDKLTRDVREWMDSLPPEYRLEEKARLPAN